MSSENPLIHCLDRLHLKDDNKLQQRAEKFQRQLESNVPPKVFNAGPNCKTVLAIHMASESLSRTDWDNSLAAQLAGCTKRAYENTVSIVRKALQLQPTVTFESLGVTFGCTTMISHVQKLWDSFSTKYISQMSAAQQTTAKQELDQPSWKGAVFYTCAKAFGERIAKNKLQELCASNSTEFSRYIKVISDVSAEELSELKKGSTISSRPRRRRGGDKEEEQEEQEKEQPKKELTKKASTTAPPVKRIRRTTSAASSNSKEITDEPPTKKRASLTATSSSSSNKKSNKSTLPPIERNENKVAPVSGIVSLINRQDYQDSKRYKDYIEWNENLKTRLSSA